MLPSLRALTGPNQDQTTSADFTPQQLAAAAWTLPLFYRQQYELHARLLPYLQHARIKRVSRPNLR